VGYVGVPHGVMLLDGADLFFRHVRMLGGPAPPQLAYDRRLNPGTQNAGLSPIPIHILTIDEQPPRTN
jgi:hypothetical protein